MHKAGVVHRDLNVGNIFYNKDGKVVISDYGSALYSTSKILKDADISFLEGIDYVYDMIKRGDTHQLRDRTSILLNSLPGSIPIVRFNYNGVLCENWE